MGMRKLLRVIDMFSILILLRVSQMSIYIESYQIVHFKYLQLYFNKAALKCFFCSFLRLLEQNKNLKCSLHNLTSTFFSLFSLDVSPCFLCSSYCELISVHSCPSCFWQQVFVVCSFYLRFFSFLHLYGKFPLILLISTQ